MKDSYSIPFIFLLHPSIDLLLINIYIKLGWMDERKIKKERKNPSIEVYPHEVYLIRFILFSILSKIMELYYKRYVIIHFRSH